MFDRVSSFPLIPARAADWMFRKVWALLFTVKPSSLLPGSMPTTIGWVLSLLGSWLSLIQNSPFFQKGVAFLDLIHRRARLGVVGMSGVFPSGLKTGTKTVSLLSECVQPFATDQRRDRKLG